MQNDSSVCRFHDRDWRHSPNGAHACPHTKPFSSAHTPTYRKPNAKTFSSPFGFANRQTIGYWYFLQ
jgi:hypothetical protein